SSAEAALADFKREKFKEAVTIQMDAFRLFAEKLNIITTSAKEVVNQLPLTPTKPGEPRNPYTGLWVLCNRNMIDCLRIEYSALVYFCSYDSISFVSPAC